MKNEMAEKVVSKMMENDHFSQWLGISVIETDAGSCKLHMIIKKDMLNGFGIAHGGITYSLADSALAFASNGDGIKSVSIDTSIAHLVQCNEGDELTATAMELHKSNKISRYSIEIVNQNSELVANFTGTVYRTGKNWF